MRGAEITGKGVRRGSEAFTQLLHEDTGHPLRQNPAGMDEARQVTPCAELHDEVDVVAVPLWLQRQTGSLKRMSLPQLPLGVVPPQARTWKSFSCTMWGCRMPLRISISVRRFSTDALFRLFLATHFMATTSRVSFCGDRRCERSALRGPEPMPGPSSPITGPPHSHQPAGFPASPSQAREAPVFWNPLPVWCSPTLLRNLFHCVLECPH